MCVQVTVIRNTVTVRNADTCRGCHLVTPLWCLDQTVPGCWMELRYLQKHVPVKVMYSCLHPQVNKVALTHSQCGRASLPGYRTNCHSATGHRPQGHRIQAGNKMTQFMLASILEQQPQWCSQYSDCAMNRTVHGWNPGRCKRFFSSLKHPDQFWDPPQFCPGHKAAEAWI